MKKKPEVGQTLYSMNIGNAARNCEQILTPVEVTKVGRKYFYAETHGKSYTSTRYQIDDWREATDYCANSELFLDRQAWLDDREAATISRKISDSFSYHNSPRHLDIHDLRLISDILNKVGSHE